MEKVYEPKAIEAKWSKHWEDKQYGKPYGTGQPYCIMIPPPNVTGTLHMGHGFQLSLMDGLVRYHRMCGQRTLWQVGTDHAGIATQMVVERRLQRKGVQRQAMGRDKFLKEVWQWKDESGGKITKQIRRLGASVDWSRERFTMDEGLSHAVTESFIRLYRQGLIYRGKRLVNWDPKLQTAISDLEVVNEERQGHLWHFRYHAVDKSFHMDIATTRPETMLGDVAVAVHPEDQRYQAYIGKKLQLPLVGCEIPVIADAAVDPEFGTGCVKITPAHDFNDYAMGQRHALPIKNIFTKDAHLNAEVPEPFQGLERFAARKKVVEACKQLGILLKVEEHTHVVPIGDRSQVVLEPWLTDQWFMHMEPLAKPAMQVVAEKKIQFFPEVWVNTYNKWLEDIQDWCISRQLWWGHRIPAWYDKEGKIYVAASEAEVRQHYKLGAEVELRQDADVLDTWFSSALWPFSTLGWPEEQQDLATFFPTQTLVTGFDIIFFWVARMIMLSLHLTGKVPFKEVYITGLIRDNSGQKMSKSKGNILDPIDLMDGIELEALLDKRVQGLMQPEMEKSILKHTKKEFPEGIQGHGSDALRFTFFALASTGRDIRFDTQRLLGYRNFCNKLWNAARFVLLQPLPEKVKVLPTKTLVDVWIFHRLHEVIADCAQHIQSYRFDLWAKTLYDFVWSDFCDWYIEASKLGLNGSQADNSKHLLHRILADILKLLHPLIPFITEEIWQQLAPRLGKESPLMIEAYPKAVATWLNPQAKEKMEFVQAVIGILRVIRSENQVAPAKTIPLYIEGATAEDQKLLQAQQPLLKMLAKVEAITFVEADFVREGYISARAAHLFLHIPMAEVLDLAAETLRLEKNIVKVQSDISTLQQRLGNPNYVAKAPKAVVEKAQQELQVKEENLQLLQQQQQQLATLKKKVSDV
jgi:valyl-tRNA synthetase